MMQQYLHIKSTLTFGAWSCEVAVKVVAIAHTLEY